MKKTNINNGCLNQVLFSLQLSFITIKLFGLVTWSWWWVFSPTLIPIALIFGFLLLVFVLGVISDFLF